MRAALLFDERPAAEWHALLQTPVGGLALFTRQVLALKLSGVTTIQLRASSPSTAADLLRRAPRVAGITFVDSDAAGLPDRPVLTQRADVIIDPRLLQSVMRRASAVGAALILFDRDDHSAARKSPHRAGVPDDSDLTPLDGEPITSGMSEIGLRVEREGRSRLNLSIGRYFWHIMRTPRDAGEATTKILLGTIKATDGIFARTNRRMSIPISRLLLRTPVTPNAVTLVTLLFSLAAGWLVSRGTYPFMVAGSLTAWFASMLDGVDGELARAKFRVTVLGHWLEMTCDYVFYVAVTAGFPFGFYRTSGHPIWLALAAGTVAAVAFAFVINTWLKRRYYRGGPTSDYYVAFQRTLDRHLSDRWFLVTRRITFLATRAACPYYIVAFSVLGLAPLVVILIFIGAQLSWVLPLYATRLDIRDDDPGTLTAGRPPADAVVATSDRTRT